MANFDNFGTKKPSFPEKYLEIFSLILKYILPFYQIVFKAWGTGPEANGHLSTKFWISANWPLAVLTFS